MISKEYVTFYFAKKCFLKIVVVTYLKKKKKFRSGSNFIGGGVCGRENSSEKSHVFFLFQKTWQLYQKYDNKDFDNINIMSKYYLICIFNFEELFVLKVWSISIYGIRHPIYVYMEVKQHFGVKGP